MSLLAQLGSYDEIEIIMRYLSDTGYSLQIGESLYPTPILLDLGDEIKPKFHSNIPDHGEYRWSMRRRAGQLVESVAPLTVFFCWVGTPGKSLLSVAVKL